MIALQPDSDSTCVPAIIHHKPGSYSSSRFQPAYTMMRKPNVPALHHAEAQCSSSHDKSCWEGDLVLCSSHTTIYWDPGPNAPAVQLLYSRIQPAFLFQPSSCCWVLRTGAPYYSERPSGPSNDNGISSSSSSRQSPSPTSTSSLPKYPSCCVCCASSA